MSTAIEYPPDPMGLIVLEWEPDEGENRSLDEKATLHEAVSAIERGQEPGAVAKALLDALTDEEAEGVRETVRNGWADYVAPDGPVGLLCLHLASEGGAESYVPRLDGREVLRVMRERDEARATVIQITTMSLKDRIAALVAEGADLFDMTAPFHADDPRAAAFCDLLPDDNDSTPYEHMIVSVNDDTDAADGWAWALCWKRLDTSDARCSELWPADHPSTGLIDEGDAP